jgi:hypothetical protein
MVNKKVEPPAHASACSGAVSAVVTAALKLATSRRPAFRFHWICRKEEAAGPSRSGGCVLTVAGGNVGESEHSLRSRRSATAAEVFAGSPSLHTASMWLWGGRRLT